MSRSISWTKQEDEILMTKGSTLTAPELHELIANRTIEAIRTRRKKLKVVFTREFANEKKCSKCKLIKPLDAFSKSKTHKRFGRRPDCKACVSKLKKNKYKESPRIRERIRQYRQTQEYRDYYNAYNRRRLKEDSEFYRKDRCRGKLTSILRSRANMDEFIPMIGCTKRFLISHIESQFRDGMTWTNRGRRGWHIDHKIPCCMFDLTDEEQIKKCFHWSNLQPLWANENYEKKLKMMGNDEETRYKLQMFNAASDWLHADISYSSNVLAHAKKHAKRLANGDYMTRVIDTKTNTIVVEFAAG